MRTWLKAKREQLGKTQDEIAEAAGVTRPAYTMIESGYRQPSVTMAKKLATAMHFDWTLFFTDEGNESTHKEVATNDQ